jgi:hypothetical protein
MLCVRFRGQGTRLRLASQLIWPLHVPLSFAHVTLARQPMRQHRTGQHERRRILCSIVRSYECAGFPGPCVTSVSADVQSTAAVPELLTTLIHCTADSQSQLTISQQMKRVYQCSLACCILCLAALTAPVQSELVLAYSIQRHGARNVLPKSADLTESDPAGGPTLLPAGQQMCYEAGRAVTYVTCVLAWCPCLPAVAYAHLI